MRRPPLPAPERFSVSDALHIALGLLMIPLGVLILVRTTAIAVTATGVVAGLAFVAFGVYRTWMALVRLRLYWRTRGGEK
jgi:hypothetical protein